jgi:hypothetical protein
MSKKWFSYKQRFYRYGNIVPASQMTVRTKYQEKDSFAHSRGTCGAVDTVQACAMALPYRTASRHHDRLMMARVPRPDYSSALFCFVLIQTLLGRLKGLCRTKKTQIPSSWTKPPSPRPDYSSALFCFVLIQTLLGRLKGLCRTKKTQIPSSWTKPPFEDRQIFRPPSDYSSALSKLYRQSPRQGDFP